MSYIVFPALTLVFYLVLIYLKVKIHKKSTPKKYPERGKSVSLILRLTKMIHGTDKIVALYYILYVLNILVHMEKK